MNKYYRLVYSIPAGGRFYWEVQATSPAAAKRAFKRQHPPSWKVVAVHQVEESP